MKFRNGLIWAAIWAAPGVILVLLAFFVIKGEMQLTIGAPGMWLAPLGAVGGFIYGWGRPVDRPQP